MSGIKWVEDQIPKHLSKHVQNTMRKHLLKEYHARAKEYWVDVRFTVKAEDKGDAASKVHEFVPDVDGDIIMWTLANSIIAEIPNSLLKRDQTSSLTEASK